MQLFTMVGLNNEHQGVDLCNAVLKGLEKIFYTWVFECFF